MNIFHSGQERPADGLPQEVDPASPRRPTYRVPRHTVDSVGIRPVDLTIIDGIETVSGGEGPWLQELAIQRPGLLLAGRNVVCTDSVATAVMGYDPMAAPATGPYPGDNHLAMAAVVRAGNQQPQGNRGRRPVDQGSPSPLRLVTARAKRLSHKLGQGGHHPHGGCRDR